VCQKVRGCTGKSGGPVAVVSVPTMSRAVGQGDDMTNEPGGAAIEQAGFGRMFTASGTIYELDFVERTMRRLPVETAHCSAGETDAYSLRRDGGFLRIIEIVHLQLGDRAIFLLEPLGPPPTNVTQRSTTPVIVFERLDLPINALDQ